MANRFTYGEGLFGRIGGVDQVKARTSQHLALLSTSDDKQVRINSRNFTQTSGSSIGFQAKPAQTVNGGSVFGGEISPRVNSGVTLSGSIVGLFVDAYLKGTAAGTITGDVRGLNIEVVTDDAGTRTISGNVSMLRLRSAFSATTITGKFVAIRVEKPETQTNSKTFDALLELPGVFATGTGAIWSDAGISSATNAGVIKCLVNGNARWINLFSGTPA